MAEEVEYFSSNEEEEQKLTPPTLEKEYVPSCKNISSLDRVPFDIKLKIVMTVNKHPTWSFYGLQTRFKRHLRHKTDTARFRKDIIKGGTYMDKMEIIKKNVYDQFIETRRREQLVTRRQLQQWAMDAAMQFRDAVNEDGSNFQFTTSASWITNFLKVYRISNRRVVRYVSNKEITSPEEIMKSAIQFQNLIQSIPNDYDSDYIINTDQTGCEYRINVARTYTHTGQKTVELFIGDLNKITHSYTAQYSLTKSGKLLPKVFVCLQESGDAFGVRVKAEVNEILKLCKNVIVVCSKSGKLSSDLYKKYLEKVIKPYVGNNPFLMIVDSWGGGHKNIHMYNEIFVNSENRPTCNLQIIPPKCTPICQPCDVYFYRQVKILNKRIQNYSQHIMADREKKELNTRYDAISIQSLIHYLLSAPLFKKMIQFAWYASKLENERDIFYNVNQLCFPPDIHNKKMYM
ncbi:LOW QUALITY PROTEIN: uncharacterized protein LOC117611086 [Osmia lignaria lignaria]|uniref:LOW QUALITY PROTEIN: uncharacterized protein LOC117611086 n=1 Tax=Osmia lignaria lignaria TaxID=1437193 RepID=UPI00402B88BC